MGDGVMQIVAKAGTDVEDVLEDEEPLVPAQSRVRLKKFLDQFEGVTHKQKHVLIRRFVDGATLKDIGEDLGISPQAAETLYKRALSRVKTAWEKYERS